MVGMQPLHMVSPASNDPIRLNKFPEELVVTCEHDKSNIKPRDLVNKSSINAMIVSMAVGGSTNVLLHGPEIARAAGYSDFNKDIMAWRNLVIISKNCSCRNRCKTVW